MTDDAAVRAAMDHYASKATLYGSPWEIVREAVDAARPIIAQQIAEYLDGVAMDGPDDAADVIREQFVWVDDNGVDR